MVNVDEFVLINTVLIAVSTANVIRKPAMNIVVYIVVRPKNSKCKPKTIISMPMTIQLSLKTLQTLET